MIHKRRENDPDFRAKGLRGVSVGVPRFSWHHRRVVLSCTSLELARCPDLLTHGYRANRSRTRGFNGAQRPSWLSMFRTHNNSIDSAAVPFAPLQWRSVHVP